MSNKPADWDEWTAEMKASYYEEGAAWDLIQLCGADPTSEAWNRAIGAVRKIAAYISTQNLAAVNRT